MKSVDPVLAEIHVDPDDDSARLVYADSLVERGDPRGELIQVQCALADLDEDDDRLNRMKHRERALVKKYGDKWLRELTPYREKLEFEFVRGFPGLVRGPIKELAKLSKKILAAAPLLTSIDAVAEDRDLDPLFQSELFAHARSVRITSWRRRIDVIGLAKLTKPLPIHRLELDDVSLSKEDVDAIARSPVLPKLRELELNRCAFGKDGPSPLAALEAPLVRFAALSGKYPEAFAQALSTSPAFAKLEALGLCNTAIGDAGLQRLIETGRLGLLTDVDLRSAGLSKKGLVALLAALPVTGVRRLLLGGNALDDDIASRVAKWSGARSLVRLDLGGYEKVGDRGARAVAESPYLANLRSLILSFATLDAKTETKLVAALPKARIYVGQRFLKRAPT